MMSKDNIKILNIGLDFVIGSIQIFKILYDIDKYENFTNKFFNFKLNPDDLLGYKLCLLTALHRITDHFVDSSIDIGIEEDETIINAYHWGSDPENNLRSLSRNTPHGILINNLLGFRKLIISSNSFDELKNNLYDVKNYIEKIEQIILKHYIGINNSKDIIEATKLIRIKSIQILLIFFNDSNKLLISYYELIKSLNTKNKIDLKDFNRTLGGNPFDTEDQFDREDRFKTFLNGYKYSNLYLWYSLLDEQAFVDNWIIFNMLYLAQSWNELDNIFGLINENVVSKIEEKEKYVKYNFEKNVEIKKEHILDLISPIFDLNIDNSEKLKALLLYRPIQYINYDVVGALNFIVVLKGLVFNNIGNGKEKIRIVEMIHGDGIYKNYSYAILVPFSTMLSDASRWWVFYRCATTMVMETTTYDMIKKILNNMKDYIEIDRIEIDEDDLKDYLRSNYVKHLEQKTGEVIDLNSAMRGALLELLISNYFYYKGYIVKTGYVYKCINRELDLVTIDKSNKIIYVVECKEKSITVDPDEYDRISSEVIDKIRRKTNADMISISHNEMTINELNNFINLINKINKKYTKFIEELEIEKDEYKIKGIFVTTELYDKILIGLPEGIEFWSWWEVKEKISSIDVNKRYIEIIENHMRSSLSPLKNPHFMQDFF